MSVPNQYKGFSKLPEAVQQKMSPELARKYQMGGSVMQRPLFRQMGGAAAPPPMAPAPAMPMAPAPAPAMPMAPPPNQGMDQRLAFAEQAGQQLGTEAAMETMTRLDGAQDYETLIDGIRGNEKPIEARYAELAGLVGEQDARQTPESVLTLTQPTIMMTEQGALDSGIGELIQSVMGDTQMTGDMRGGVGSLMEKGAGNTPPVNFNQGGPVEVQKFDNGNVADRAVALQKSFLPAFQGIYGTPEERQEQLEKDKRFAQSQILFDIAQAGLNLAGTTQGNTLAERLAAASSGLPQAIGQRAASVQEAERALKAQDQQAKAAALQAGISQAQAEQAQKAALLLAKAKKNPDFKQVYGLDPKTQRPTIIGEYNRNDPNANKVLQSLAALTADGKLFDMERYKTELRLEEKTRGPQDSDPFEVLLPFSVKTQDGSKIDFAAGEIAFLTDAQKQTYLGKFKPYDANKGLITLYKKDGSALKTFYEGDPQIKTLIDDGSFVEDREVFLAANREAEAQDREKDIRTRPEVISKDGQIIELTFNDNGTIKDKKVIGTYGEEDTFGSSLTGRALEFFNSKTKDTDDGTEISVIDLYAQNKLSEDQTRIMESFIRDFTNPETTVGGVKVKSLPNFVELAIIDRLKKGQQSPVPLNSLPLTKDLQQKFGLIQPLQLEFGPDGKIDYSRFEDMPSIIIGGVDLTNAQGFMSGFKTFGNFIAGQAAEVGIGSGVFGKGGELTLKARDQLDSLARKTIKDMRAANEGRVLKLELEKLESEVEKFGGTALNTDARALNGLETLRNSLALEYNGVVKLLEYIAVKPSMFEETRVEAAKKAKLDLETLLGEYTAAIMSYKYAESKSKRKSGGERLPRKSNGTR